MKSHLPLKLSKGPSTRSNLIDLFLSIVFLVEKFHLIKLFEIKIFPIKILSDSILTSVFVHQGK